MLTLTVAVSDPNSLESLRVYVPASFSFTPLIVRVVMSSVVSIWNLPLSLLDSVLPERVHSTSGTGSPEKAQATVRTFPLSMLILSGTASIFGGTPV